MQKAQYFYADSYSSTHFGKRNKQAQQPPYLHGRSDTPIAHSWKEKKVKKMSIVASLHTPI